MRTNILRNLAIIAILFTVTSVSNANENSESLTKSARKSAQTNVKSTKKNNRKALRTIKHQNDRSINFLNKREKFLDSDAITQPIKVASMSKKRKALKTN